MKLVKQVIFRYLTNADFFNINKPSGTEEGGGGQSYIDFPTSEVSLSGWESFLNSIKNIEVSEENLIIQFIRVLALSAHIPIL